MPEFLYFAPGFVILIEVFSYIIHRILRIPYRLHYYVRPKASKKTIATVVFLHGIGDSLESWDQVYANMPSNVKVIGIDLLGFGKSPKPSWVTYNAKTQAAAVLGTLLRMGVRRPVIIVGHSMGAIVGVEIAKRAPFAVTSLILCSPPFYTAEQEKKRLFPNTDTLLKDIYRMIKRNPETFVKLATIAKKVGIISKKSDLSDVSMASYMDALEASIVNQSSLEDVKRLKKPVTIIYGRFDGLVVPANLRQLGKQNDTITVKSVLAGHEIQGLFVSALNKELDLVITNGTKGKA